MAWACMCMESLNILLVLSVLLLLMSCTRGSAFTASPTTPNKRIHHGIVMGPINTNTKLRAVTPKLIVFDLDNTLWTPELYQLRKLQRNHQFPVAGKDVKLYPAAAKIIGELRERKNSTLATTKFAIASRTKSGEWAHDLIEQFGIKDLFDYIEIFSGDKKRHFGNLKRDTGIDFKDMLFFDDNRDGKYGNCAPVASLGVLSVHCPNGLYEEEVWTTALEKYGAWASECGSPPNTIVEWDGSVTTTQPTDPNKRHTGIVKNVNRQKRFGFIRYGDRNKTDVFFHFSALPSVDSVVEAGDELSFSVATDARKKKDAAADIRIVSSSGTRSAGARAEAVTLRVFSMSLPFAALLSNGYKTLETRNGTMFVPYEAGTTMLLHVGERTYPDANRHLEVMRSGGLGAAEISALKSLPPGFGTGMVVAIVELGDTYDTTLEERCEPDFQRSVGAFGADSGRRATEIRRVAYLKRGVRVSEKIGVFKASIDRDLIPDGWLDDDATR